MHVETDFKGHETDFKGHEDVISRGTPVPTTNKELPSHNTKKEKARPKATYLPEDWSRPPKVVAQMRDEQPHIDQDLELKKIPRPVAAPPPATPQSATGPPPTATGSAALPNSHPTTSRGTVTPKSQTPQHKKE